MHCLFAFSVQKNNLLFIQEKLDFRINSRLVNYMDLFSVAAPENHCCLASGKHIRNKQKIRTLHQSVKSSDYSFLVGRGGFEPPKSLTADLQSAPFGHSGTYPYSITKKWSWWTDSNPRPADYKSAALPTELHQHLERLTIIA